MRSFLVLLVASSICASNAAYQNNSDDSDLDFEFENSIDETLVYHVDELFETFRQSIDDANLTTIMNSVDKQCMLNEYGKYNFSAEIFDGIDMSREITDVVAIAAFFDTAAKCSKEFLAVTFETLMREQVLVKSFIDDHELKDYVEMLSRAYNARGEYCLAFSSFSGKTELKCLGVVDLADKFIVTKKLQAAQHFNTTCLNKNFEGIEKFVMKNVLLIEIKQDQVGHSERKVLRKILECVRQVKNR